MSRRLRLLSLVPALLVVVGLMPAASASSTTGLVPLLDCVTYSSGANTLTATFGYVNTNAAQMDLPIGGDNFFTPGPVFQGQPVTFLPGVNHGVFQVTFPLGTVSAETWTLAGTSVTASNDPKSYCAGGAVPADSSLTMTPSLTTTVGTDAELTATVTDPAAPTSGSYGTVLLALPDGLETAPLASGGPCASVSGNASLIACAVSSVAGIPLDVHAAAPGSYRVVGTFVPSREGDAVAGNNSAATTVRVTAAPTASTGPAGSLTATSAQLTGTVDPDGVATTATFTYWPDGHADQAVTTPGDDAGDGFAPVPVTAALSGLTPGTTYRYALSATSTSGTTTGGQESFTTPTVPTPASGLSVTASTAQASVTVGAPVSETFTVADGGPSDATAVRLTVQLSDQASSVTATPGSGSCTVSGTPAVVTCELGTVPAGTTDVVTLGATGASAGTLLGVAFVSGAEADPSVADNTATTAVTVTPAAAQSADLSVAIAAPRSAHVGVPLTAVVTVRNAGPGTATGVQLALALPALATVGSVTADQGTCTRSGCALGSIPAGGAVAVRVTLTPRYPGWTELVATVGAQTPDPATANNRAEAHIPITWR